MSVRSAYKPMTMVLASALLLATSVELAADDPSRGGSNDRFLAIQVWEGSFKVEFERSVDMPYPPPMVNRHAERARSSGRGRLDMTGGPIGGWNGQLQVSAAHSGVSQTNTPAFTGSGVTTGQAVLPGEATLRIDPLSGQYQVSLRIHESLPVVERTWTELAPEIDQIAAAASSGDLEGFLLGFPALLAKGSIPSATVTERQVTAPGGSSDSQPLPASGLVLAGSRKYGGTTFSWSLRPAVEDRVRIYLIEDGLFKDVTDQTSDVLTGQRVELEGRAIRLGEVVSFEWEIGGLDEGMAIDDWTVENNAPRVVPVKDTRSSTVDFAWWSGREGGEAREIVFKATLRCGEELTARTEFRVYRPRAAVDANIGTVGVREVRVQGRDRSELGLLDTDSSKGITFNGQVTLPAQFSTPFEMQYVQLTAWDAYRLRLGARMVWDRTTSEGTLLLDGEYPYPSERRHNAQYTDDSPAAPLTQTAAAQAVMDFETYLMFRPEGRGNIWVPLKRIDWGWRGYATYRHGGHPGLMTRFEDFMLVRENVVGPRVSDAAAYPHWVEVKRAGRDVWRPVRWGHGVDRADQWHPPAWPGE